MTLRDGFVPVLPLAVFGIPAVVPLLSRRCGARATEIDDLSREAHRGPMWHAAMRHRA